jgi:hypothetical protein
VGLDLLIPTNPRQVNANVAINNEDAPTRPRSPHHGKSSTLGPLYFFVRGARPSHSLFPPAANPRQAINNEATHRNGAPRDNIATPDKTTIASPRQIVDAFSAALFCSRGSSFSLASFTCCKFTRSDQQRGDAPQRRSSRQHRNSRRDHDHLHTVNRRRLLHCIFLFEVLVLLIAFSNYFKSTRSNQQRGDAPQRRFSRQHRNRSTTRSTYGKSSALVVLHHFRY